MRSQRRAAVSQHVVRQHRGAVRAFAGGSERQRAVGRCERGARVIELDAALGQIDRRLRAARAVVLALEQHPARVRLISQQIVVSERDRFLQHRTAVEGLCIGSATDERIEAIDVDVGHSGVQPVAATFRDDEPPSTAEAAA
jgi:hypothetical protein